jgi:hypothetical protein
VTDIAPALFGPPESPGLESFLGEASRLSSTSRRVDGQAGSSYKRSSMAPDSFWLDRPTLVTGRPGWSAPILLSLAMEFLRR